MHHDTTTLARYVPDLAKDKFHVWITKYHYVPMIVLGLVLLAIGGLPFLLWGVFMRTVVGLHTTWLVNSATHSWGTRRFVTRDLSTNSWWVAILTFGEGWHNNHHAHPVSAQHGLRWYEIDMNWYGIWALKKLGLARHMYRVKLSELDRKTSEASAPESRLNPVIWRSRVREANDSKSGSRVANLARDSEFNCRGILTSFSPNNCDLRCVMLRLRRVTCAPSERSRMTSALTLESLHAHHQPAQSDHHLSRAGRWSGRHGCRALVSDGLSSTGAKGSKSFWA